MEPLQTLYNVLQLNRKIEDFHIRILYMKDVWGMEQTLIGQCEGISQSYVSKELIKAREIVSRETLLQHTMNIWTSEEVQFVQYLPREIISDVQVLAFIEHILGVHPVHPFFQHFDTSVNARIAALAALGIQNKRLMVLFDKNQPTISMSVKRGKERAVQIQRPNRYEKIGTYVLSDRPYINKFVKAGGQS